MGINEALNFIHEAMESKKNIKKKPLKAVIEKLDENAKKLARKIKIESNDKKRAKYISKMKINRVHAKKGRKILAKLD